jgi:Pentapeptide repeats (9 copies)
VDSCAHTGCGAPRLTAEHCPAHSSTSALGDATTRWQRGEPIDLRGASIERDWLEGLLAAVAESERESHPTPLDPNRRIEIPSDINLEGAWIGDGASFRRVVFKGAAYFDHAEFCGPVDFGGAEFCDHADFDNAIFGDDASFRGAIFDDHAGFQKAWFRRNAKFVSARFRSYVDLEGTRFADLADFTEASFQFARRLGSFDVEGRILLDECEFAERTTIEISASHLSASSAIFADGVRLLVGSAEMVLDCADFGRAATLSGRIGAAGGAGERGGEVGGMPRLLTLHGAQVSSLAISGVDLRDCSFFGAHGLELMTIEPSCRWRHTPSRRRLIDRQMIDEEQRWRERRELRRRPEGWQRPGVWSREVTTGETKRPDVPGARDLDPMELAALYRALRKAREDNKDQAGSGDLYYGEMEMRRVTKMPKGRGSLRAFGDRLIITAYWLLSGYGLKANRSLVAWLLVTGAATVALVRWGISPTPSLSRGALFAAESTSSLIRPAHLPSPYELGETGELIQLGLRVIGPILFGLFLLALRARVKR